MGTGGSKGQIEQISFETDESGFKKINVPIKSSSKYSIEKSDEITPLIRDTFEDIHVVELQYEDKRITNKSLSRSNFCNAQLQLAIEAKCKNSECQTDLIEDDEIYLSIIEKVDTETQVSIEI